MTPVFHERTHDCFTACIASLLDLHIMDVPNFYHGITPGQPVPEDRLEFMRKWFALRGLYLLDFPFKDENSSLDIMESMMLRHPGLHYIVTGQSRKGVDHAVVCRDGEVVHDPSGKHGGLHGPQADGCYHVCLIGKLV